MKILKSCLLKNSIQFARNSIVRWKSNGEVLCELVLKKPFDMNFMMIVQLNCAEANELGLINALGVIQGIKEKSS